MNRDLRDRIHAAARELFDAHPWTRLEGEDFFGFVHPATGLRACVSVIGSAGMDRGLSIWMGERGFEQAMRMVAGAMGEDEVATKADLLSLTFDRSSEVPKSWRNDGRVLPPFETGGEKVHPCVWHKPAGRLQEPPDNAHAALIESLARAVPRLLSAGRLAPERDSPPRRIAVFELPATPDGEIRDLDAWLVPARALESEIEKLVLPEDVAARLRLRRPEGELAATFPLIPATIGDDPIRVLILVAPSGFVLDGRPFVGPAALSEAALHLAKLLAGAGPALDSKVVPLPETLLTDTLDLQVSLQPARAPFGVRVEFEKGLEMLEEVKGALIASMVPSARGSRKRGMPRR